MRRIPEQTRDLVPQATAEVDVDDLLRPHGPPDDRCDDLDHWRGAVFEDDDGIQFAVKRYRGFPPGMASLYVEWSMTDVDMITARVARIATLLGIPEARITWQRRDGLTY